MSWRQLDIKRWYQFSDYDVTVWQPPIDDFWQVILKILNKAIVWFWRWPYESGHFWNHILYSCTFFYMNRPFVQTKTVNPLTETAYFWNRTPEWFRTLSTRIRVAKYPASKMLKFSFSIKVYISNDIFNCHYYTYVTRASIIVCFFCTILFGLESHNLRRDNRLKIICRRQYITTKFYTYHFCHHDCSLQCQNVRL